MIKLQNVSKDFNTTKVLKNISLNIKKGECIVLKGVSGSGKSTLLSIIASLMKPTSGLVEVDGVNIVTLSDFHLSSYRNNTIGFITQDFHLFDMLSVSDNIVVPLLLSNLTQNEAQKKVSEVMDIAFIKHKANSEIHTLSGGEKQRCLIARVLVNNPKIILCDEPTASLDRENSLNFIQIIKMLKEKGKTILIATHDPLIYELDWIDKLIKMDDGSLE